MFIYLHIYTYISIGEKDVPRCGLELFAQRIAYFHCARNGNNTALCDLYTFTYMYDMYAYMIEYMILLQY